MQWKCLNLNDNHRDLLKTIKPTNKSVLIAYDWVLISCLFFHLDGRKTSQEFIKLFFPRSVFFAIRFMTFLFTFAPSTFPSRLPRDMPLLWFIADSYQLITLKFICRKVWVCGWEVITVQLSCEFFFFFFWLASVNYRRCHQISKMFYKWI